VELALKARICYTLGWSDFPSTAGEFRSYQSFRTHDLDVLLHLSGVESLVRLHHLAQWSVVTLWDSEARYRPIGTTLSTEVQLIIQATRILLGVI
jgi:hypothetical protein